MRIRQLGIENVLHFDKFGLDFGDHEAGLHIVYGPNEAGKSTILRVLIDLLFGGKIDDEFKDGYDSKSRIAGILMASGRLLSNEIAATDAKAGGLPHHEPDANNEAQSASDVNNEAGARVDVTRSTGDAKTEVSIARKKKYSRLVLTDDTQAELPEDLVLSLLGGLDKERYTLLFGFNHDRLRLGGDSLLESGGHAGISLFEAGGGIQFLQALLGTLAERTDAILDASFRANSNKALNAAWREYKELKTAARKDSLRGEDWHRLKNEIDTKETGIKTLEQQLGETRAKETQLQRIGRTRHFVADRKDLQLRLDEMESARELTSQLDEQIERDVDGLERIDEQIGEKAQALRSSKESLAGIVVNETILEAADPINALNQRMEQYSEASKRLPGLAQQIEVEVLRLQSLVLDLAPSQDVSDVRALRIPENDNLELRQLADDWIELNRKLEQMENDILESDAQLSRLQGGLDKLGQSPDLTRLRQLLEEVRTGDVEASIAQLTRDIAGKRENAKRLLITQSIWGGALEDLPQLALPLAETVSRYADEFSDMEQQIAQCKREIAKKTGELESLAEQMETLQLSGKVPVAADLALARGHRDRGWKLIRVAWLKELSGSAEADSLTKELASYTQQKPLPDAFEDAMVEADKVSDWMRRESERSARLTEYQIQEQRAQRALTSLQEDLAVTEHTYEKLQETWKKEWSAAAISPKSPVEMRGWLADYYRPLVKDISEIQTLEHRQKDQAATRDELIRRLSQACTEARASVGAGATPGETTGETNGQGNALRNLVSLCTNWVRETDNNEARRSALTEQVELLAQKRHLQGVQQTNARQALAALQERFAGMQTAYPFLPKNPKVVDNYLDKLRELFVIDREVERLRKENERVQVICTSFERRAAELAAEVGQSTEGTEPLSYSDLVSGLVDDLTAAGQQAKEHEWLQQQVESLEQDVRHLEQKKETLATAVEEYKSQYQCFDHEGLRVLVARSREKKRLRAQMEEIETSLRRAGGNGLGVAALVTEVEQGPAVDALDSLTEQVQASIEQQQSTLQRENQELWEHKRQFEEMNVDRSDAADDVQQAEFQLAKVDRHWNEYLRLELARRLLARAIEEFREQNESTVIARASEFFSTLTLGHYQELTVEYDGVNPVLEAITRDNERRRVGHMSDGTRDQLYLALRLAFVEQHIDSTEAVPLIMDDILVHFDDERTQATLEVLGRLAVKTQILYFTHHQSIVEAANSLSASGDAAVSVHSLIAPTA